MRDQENSNLNRSPYVRFPHKKISIKDNSLICSELDLNSFEEYFPMLKSARRIHEDNALQHLLFIISYCLNLICFEVRFRKSLLSLTLTNT